MFNWVEIGLDNNKERFENLSAFLSENGVPNKVDFLKTSPENFENDLKKVLAEYDGVRVGRGCGELIISQFIKFPVMVRLIKSADSIVKKDGTWWLEAFAVEGFLRVLHLVGDKLDFNSWALVIGSGAAARSAVTSLFMQGFRNFSISGIDIEQVNQLVEDLSRVHLGINLKAVPKESLILLPGNHIIMVNTTPMEGKNPMLEELYYFNFFKVGGVAVDFSIVPIESDFIKGAREIGATCVHGYQVCAQTDLLWAEQITGKKLDQHIETYQKSLYERLSKS